MIDTILHYLESLLVALAPYATPGILAGALVVAANRLPILSIGAMVATTTCLGALLSTGDGGSEAGLAVAVAGGIAALILLLSGGQLWERPSLRLHRFLPAGLKNMSLLLASGSRTPDPESRTPDPESRTPDLLFRLVAVAILALAAETFARQINLPIGAQELRIGAWLALMGAFAALSSGNVIISATGFVIALSAAELAVPDLVGDPALRPAVYGAIAAVIILAALGFSFAARLPRPATTSST